MRVNGVRLTGTILAGVLATLFAKDAQAAPVVRFDLPERFRTLVDQRFDLRVEARDLANPTAVLHLSVNGHDVTRYLPAPEITLDNDAFPSSLDKAWTFRNVALPSPGLWTFTASVSDGGDGSATQRIGVQPFSLHGRKNVILFLGDAMGTAYRDAGRIVSRSTDNRFREGFFDELQEMDQMPVTGMVMTYALDRVVPDSANTATAWSTGSKTNDGALGGCPDSDDFRFNGGNLQATK
ncbi:MAG: alkaline phosphatase, partial [bacterium]